MTDFEIRPFVPAPGLGNPHAQTVAGALLRPRGAVRFRRERLTTPDRDFLDLDWGPEAAAAEAPVVLILHGLEGSVERGYVQQSAVELHRRGIRAVGLNFRGCSGEANRTARFYHSGETGDLHFAIAHIRRKAPGRPLGLLGFSLGGNVVLKYLGEAARHIGASAAVSVPYDLAAGAEALRTSRPGALYTRLFLRSLRRKLRAKRPQLAPLCDVDAALRATTLRGFDEAATAPLHGFASAADYYTRSSSGRFLAGIRTPTLLLQARDDPFQPEGAIPYPVIQGNPDLVDGIQDRGGHVGFVAGSVRRPVFWGESEAARFLGSRLVG